MDTTSVTACPTQPSQGTRVGTSTTGRDVGRAARTHTGGKRPTRTQVGFGIYTNPHTGEVTFNHGLPSERVIYLIYMPRKGRNNTPALGLSSHADSSMGGN